MKKIPLFFILLFISCSHLGKPNAYSYTIKYALENRIAYIDEGNGIPIIFNHAWTFDLRYFEESFLYFIKKGFRVIAYDLPGHGLSKKEDYAYTATFYGKVLSDFIKELNLENPVLIGNSLGGLLIIRSILDYNLKSRAIVLVSSTGMIQYTPKMIKALSYMVTRKDFMNPATFKLKEWLSDFLLDNDKIEIWEKRYLSTMESPEFSLYKNAIVKTFIKIKENDGYIADKLNKIDIPALIIWGSRDAFYFPSYGEEICKKIKNSKFELIENAGHLPMVDAPDAFNKKVYNYLKERLNL